MRPDLFARQSEHANTQLALATLEHAPELMPYFKTIADPRGTSAWVEGREVRVFASSDYLGLAHDPRVSEAAIAATRRYGTSMSGSRFACGTLDLHLELEAELAAYFGTEAALVLPTGYQTNLAALGTFAGPGDHLLIDERAHASLIDGARASRATVVPVAHEDLADLEAKLAAVPGDAAALVIVDGVYSMDGTLCRLEETVAVARSAGARVLVDDAHAAGVLGGGLGTAAELGLEDGGDVQTITFSKALASVGGAVLADRSVIDFLKYASRPLIFTAAAPAGDTAAALAALRIAAGEPERAEHAMALAAKLRDGLTDAGFEVNAGPSPIVTLATYDVQTTLALWRGMLDAGVFTGAVVPPGASYRLRLCVTAGHSEDDVAAVVSVATAARAGLASGWPEAIELA